jgi:hypothetical protein
MNGMNSERGTRLLTFLISTLAFLLRFLISRRGVGPSGPEADLRTRISILQNSVNCVQISSFPDSFIRAIPERFRG